MSKATQEFILYMIASDLFKKKDLVKFKRQFRLHYYIKVNDRWRLTYSLNHIEKYASRLSSI